MGFGTNNTLSHYDVVIIGGGPSGAAVAIQSAMLGLTVAIIEGDATPKERPGEIIHPGIEILLKKLDIFNEFSSLGFLRHDGIDVQWNDKLNFKPYNSDDDIWQGYQIWRPSFDTLLLEKAMKLGVNVIRPCRAIHPIFENNRIVGTKTNNSTINSSILVDATGSASWIAHKLKIQIKKYSPCLVARFGYVEGNCQTVNVHPSLIANDEGWTWTAKIRPQLYQWIRVNFNNQNNDSIPYELSNLHIHGSVRSADVTWRIISKPAGLGYFAVGDAAFVLDPASSHGILKAIMSGMMTAHIISKIINDSSVEELAIAEYSRWIKEWFLHDVKRLKELYANHPFPPKWINTNQTNSTNGLNTCILPE